MQRFCTTERQESYYPGIYNGITYQPREGNDENSTT
jgi:hypothetical protein